MKGKLTLTPIVIINMGRVENIEKQIDEVEKGKRYSYGSRIKKSKYY